MKRYIIKILTAYILVFTTVTLFLAQGADTHETREEIVFHANENFQPTTQELRNPGRGFYMTNFLALTPEGAVGSMHPNNPSRAFIHLRVGLAAFDRYSGNGDFTEATLDALAQLLRFYRENNNTAVIRFAYCGFNGYNHREPPLEQILRHVEQLGYLFHEYQDVVAAVETGMFGPWGEQHGSELMYDFANMDALIEAFLKVVPGSRTISVRQPAFFAHWARVEYDDLHVFVAPPDSPARRVGLFNDGMLGNWTDMGTFRQRHPNLPIRQNEIRWLNRHATHTLYGGEVVRFSPFGQWWSDDLPPERPINTAEFIMEEMFRVRLSYLNIEWYIPVLNSWRDVTLPSGETAFNFISNHMGYRYFIRDAASLIEHGYVNIFISIRNAGAGNMVNEKITELVIASETYNFAVVIDFDIRSLLSQNTIYLESAFPVHLLSEGEWGVYLRVREANYAIGYELNNSVMFANEDVWSEDLQANRVGYITVATRYPPPLRAGDVNRDGYVTAADIAMLRAYLAGFPVEICKLAADVNGDGEITAADVALIRAYLAGFPVVLQLPHGSE